MYRPSILESLIFEFLLALSSYGVHLWYELLHSTISALETSSCCPLHDTLSAISPDQLDAQHLFMDSSTMHANFTHKRRRFLARLSGLMEWYNDIKLCRQRRSDNFLFLCSSILCSSKQAFICPVRYPPVTVRRMEGRGKRVHAP